MNMIVTSLLTGLSFVALAVSAQGVLPAAGGPYIISSITPGNVDSQFLTVANSQTLPGTAIITTFLTGIPPQNNQLWFLTKLGDDESFGIYKFQSALGSLVNFGMGVQDQAPAVVSPGGSVFNVSTTSVNGQFTIGVVNAFSTPTFNSGLVVTSMSQDIAPGQRAQSSALTAGNTAQMWSIRLAPN
ncbi:hypothetical protein EXIGLDRAFT_836335 [Exidia glandulosa HHB12029]|uniref:Ricin B lectin domain-containing protein n=1 Tax=Exidia glandulosa HHB12029 TaxID=1314781 RepID=A0A165HVX1_EXIGL|nr:hypothetical protein EXIGLDRAFT_836335 [Exidia glandulosa HHB12029]